MASPFSLTTAQFELIRNARFNREGDTGPNPLYVDGGDMPQRVELKSFSMITFIEFLAMEWTEPVGSDKTSVKDICSQPRLSEEDKLQLAMTWSRSHRPKSGELLKESQFDIIKTNFHDQDITLEKF